ncbi:MAG: lipase secretion chaperone [Pseudomonadota bacterium]
MRRTLPWATVVALVAAAVAWRPGSAPGSGVVEAPASAGTNAVVATPSVPAAPAAVGRGPATARSLAAARVALPPSLADVEIDGAIRFDADGRLVTDASLRRLYDFLLTTLGEQDLATIRGQLRAIALAAGDEAQAQAVLDTFERYLGYLQATDDITTPDIAGRLDALASLRRSWLGESMAAGFFGAEERYARATLARDAVLEDASLSPAEREAALDEIDATLDPRLVIGRERALAHLDVVAETEAFEVLDVDATTRFEQRAAQYGVAAAERLETLDSERAVWSDRVDRYFTERERIDAARLGIEDRAAAIAALEADFTAAERRRLAALERIRDGG